MSTYKLINDLYIVKMLFPMHKWMSTYKFDCFQQSSCCVEEYFFSSSQSVSVLEGHCI